MIPTAEEFLNTEEHWRVSRERDTIHSHVEFAKLHVNAQREAILAILRRRGDHNNIDKNIILNAYPLEKII